MCYSGGVSCLRIEVEDIEQHCHRFLWRNLENLEPDTYVICRLNMGERPVCAIGIEAIYLTADLFQPQFPKVADMLRCST